MLGAISRKLLFIMTRSLFLGEVIGTENLPQNGPYIIVANHASFFDHFIIGSLLVRFRKERVYYLTKKESFEKTLSRIWHISVGCIPLNRDSADTAAFRTTIRYLHEGKIVCIYPEGTRSFTGKMLPGKQGAVRLAIMAKVPIVPIGMQRTFDILPKGRKMPRFLRAKVQIGSPIQLPEKISKKDLSAIGLDIMEQIALLSCETGDQYKALADDQSILAPSTEEMLDAACEYNEQGIRHDPTDPLPPKLLFMRAKHLCEEVMKKHPDDWRAHFELGRAIGRIAMLSHPLKKIALAKKSRQHFERAVQLKPDFGHGHYALGMWHLSAPGFLGGNKATSLQQYSLASRLEPNEIFIRIGLAQCQLKLGMVEEARQTLMEALQLEPTKPEDFRRRLEVGALLLRLHPKMDFEGSFHLKVG